MNINNLIQSARKHYFERNLAQAEHVYKKILKKHRNNICAYYELGRVYEDQERLDEAIMYYQKVINLDPKFAGSYNNLGNIYMGKGQLDRQLLIIKELLIWIQDLLDLTIILGEPFKIWDNFIRL